MQIRMFFKPTFKKILLPAIITVLTIYSALGTSNLLDFPGPIYSSFETVLMIFAIPAIFTAPLSAWLTSAVLVNVGFRSHFACWMGCMPANTTGWVLVILFNMIFWYIMSCVFSLIYRKIKEKRQNKE